MAKQEFLSKTGLEIYHEEVKGYIEDSVESANTFATEADATVLSEAKKYSETLAAEKANASDLAEIQMGLGKYNSTLSWNSDETVYTETWTYNGKNYRQVLTEVSDTQFTKQLYVNDVLVGTWTLTINESGMVANTVYTA